ncbi:MAG: hypothetical protein MI923_10135 [Phycisphaerales bacterium]|nr:hypothetical protein [Phycisphaerales bacterium]
MMVAGLALSSFVVTGCAHLNNPWKDSSEAIDEEMMTASAEGYQNRTEYAASMRRDWTQETVYYENGAVTHWPLWFEDPFEDKGNDRTEEGDRDPIDNRFAWNWADYLHMGYGPGRMLLNTVCWPISAVVTPPGTLMESDGRLDKGLMGYDHDAKRSDAVTREPPDVNVINKVQSEPTEMQEIADQIE